MSHPGNSNHGSGYDRALRPIEEYLRRISDVAPITGPQNVVPQAFPPLPMDASRLDAQARIHRQSHPSMSSSQAVSRSGTDPPLRQGCKDSSSTWRHPASSKDYPTPQASHAPYAPFSPYPPYVSPYQQIVATNQHPPGAMARFVSESESCVSPGGRTKAEDEDFYRIAEASLQERHIVSRCTDCGKRKPARDFPTSQATESKLAKRCKECYRKRPHQVKRDLSASRAGGQAA